MSEVLLLKSTEKRKERRLCCDSLSRLSRLHPQKKGKTFGTQSIDMARAGHGKPGKSWNLIVGHGKSWKIKVVLGRLDTADVKAWTM